MNEKMIELMKDNGIDPTLDNSKILKEIDKIIEELEYEIDGFECEILKREQSVEDFEEVSLWIKQNKLKQH